MIFLFEIGFLPIRFLDLLDIGIVGYVMYRIFKLLRGSIAFNIFIGVIMLFVIWWLVGIFEMDLLSVVLGQFVSVGVIMLIIIFQPEVRRFLLILGNTTLRQRYNFLERWLDKSWGEKEEKHKEVQTVKAALLRMSQNKTGALIVLADNIDVDVFSQSGVVLNAVISEPLLVSIFNKNSPLHDGAVIISEGRIHAASCVLPISEAQNLPGRTGLRHRAAVGVTENTSMAAFVVSEEKGDIAYAYEGKIIMNVTDTQLSELLLKHFNHNRK